MDATTKPPWLAVVESGEQTWKIAPRFVNCHLRWATGTLSTWPIFQNDIFAEAEKWFFVVGFAGKSYPPVSHRRGIPGRPGEEWGYHARVRTTPLSVPPGGFLRLIHLRCNYSKERVRRRPDDNSLLLLHNMEGVTFWMVINQGIDSTANFQHFRTFLFTLDFFNILFLYFWFGLDQTAVAPSFAYNLKPIYRLVITEKLGRKVS